MSKKLELDRSARYTCEICWSSFQVDLGSGRWMEESPRFSVSSCPASRDSCCPDQHFQLLFPEAFKSYRAGVSVFAESGFGAAPSQGLPSHSGAQKTILSFFLSFFLVFLGPHMQHMEVPRSNQSHSCQPIPQPQQRQILNPLS